MRRGGVPGVQLSTIILLKSALIFVFMSLYFPRGPLVDFRVTPVSLDSHPSLSCNLDDALYKLEDPETRAWKYFQFRLLGDVPRKVDDWTICSDYVAARRFNGKKFSALVVGVWNGVSPAPLQTALFHAGYTAYTLFKGKRIPLDDAWELGRAVGRSYVTLNCPENLESLDHYLKTS